jgi:hypothetical protein
MRSPMPKRAKPMARTSMRKADVSLKAAKPVPVQPQDPPTLAPRLATAPKRVAKPRGSKTAALRAYERVIERSGYVCEVNAPGCLGTARHVHHRRLRGQGGDNSMANLLNVCAAAVDAGCHAYIHAHPEESYANGWLVHAWADPEAIPVQRGEAAA